GGLPLRFALGRCRRRRQADASGGGCRHGQRRSLSTHRAMARPNGAALFGDEPHDAGRRHRSHSRRRASRVQGGAGRVTEAPMGYELYYWPDIQGRGEFVRLALEDAAAPYRDVARGPDGDDAIVDWFKRKTPHPPFAPPFLVHGDVVIGQTANILLY